MTDDQDVGDGVAVNGSTHQRPLTSPTKNLYARFASVEETKLVKATRVSWCTTHKWPWFEPSQRCSVPLSPQDWQPGWGAGGIRPCVDVPLWRVLEPGEVF